MNSNYITYRPYRSNTFFAMFSGLLGMLSLVLIVCSLYSPGMYIVYLVLFLIASIALTKYFFDTAKWVVWFGSNDMHFLDGRNKTLKTFSWESIKNVYATTNIKGYQFVVLSCDDLSQREAKQYANRGAISAKIYIDNTIILPIDPLQNTERIKKLIQEATKKTVEGSLS